ncbi:BPTD_3080 family restriction endonuclease [Methylomonas koyamae]|uniref:BPTD_3080 family restriction endonuclease n=1 Tax=Methylomonas koyamae TaxID=702114 RepID=UPI000BC35B24|nr:DEAD/DEAH box helicase family protein [Methylomonas koyamae]ATG89121.1 type III restriction endonuclease subunit R [Methylomonas koyamae]
MSQSLIINNPYVCPQQHWGEAQNDGSLAIVPTRRSAGYEIFDTRNQTRRFIELKQVNKIRKRVDDWREAGYPGVTSISRRLLEHWHDASQRSLQFYFCQLEAIEALIWWVEAPESYKQGIAIEGDGGAWQRLCNKMATGTGKTTVMAMIITWQVLNAVTFPRRKEFSKAIFIVTPGITVKERLQVLYPGHVQNYYDEFSLCPSDSLRQKLNQVELLIENWHQLMPQKPPERSVVKKGAESDEAFTRRVLGKLAVYKDLVIINDEAHHAYRVKAEMKISKKEAEELGVDLDEATRWIEGLDRIHKTRRILRCFDLSATPFAPTGKRNTEAGLFEWIVSDFGLNDAIEAGLVKTPRVVVRDSGLPIKADGDFKSRLYHIYNDPDVKDDLNRRGAEPHEPLPTLVQQAYTLLSADWKRTLDDWRNAGHTQPPVMLTVCNRTETAARVEHYFNKGDCHFAEMHAPEKTLRVDSKILEKAELGEKASADKDYEARLKEIIEAANIPDIKKQSLLELKKEEQLRAIVDNVGKRGQAGQDIQNVVSVAMLSEGWDAKTVTHIMGLRAFTSQLLCEQVIGRGLRRVAYETDEQGLFLPEYVNIFGVPLSIFQADEGGPPPPPPKPSTQIESLPERNAFEISWPNVLRVETVIKPQLVLDWTTVESLEIKPELSRLNAEMAEVLAGKTDLSKLSLIDLENFEREFRLQTFVFRAARKVFDGLQGKHFKGDRDYLALQLIQLVEQFLSSEKITIASEYYQEDIRRRVLLSLNIDLIVQHLARHIEQQNLERVEPIFDSEFPIGSTANMRTWYTTKPNHVTQKSQISHVVLDSGWEAAEAYHLEHSDLVAAYAKNDHLGFYVLYLFNGVVRKFFPDYVIRLASGKTLILEVKGQDSEQNKVKRQHLDQWVKAVNQHGGFGEWCADVSFSASDVGDILAKHVKSLE